MVVLIDTNVIIDFLVAREPFYDSALHVMEKCASGEAEGYIAFHSLPNLWYILRKVPAETRRSWLEKVCKILKVASASQEAVMKAIKMDRTVQLLPEVFLLRIHSHPSSWIGWLQDEEYMQFLQPYSLLHTD